MFIKKREENMTLLLHKNVDIKFCTKQVNFMFSYKGKKKT